MSARPSGGDDGGEESGVVRAIARNLREPSTSWVAVGSLVGGVGAYLFQVVGTRALGDAAYAPISVLWTIQYLVFSIPLPPVEAHITRSVTLRGSHPRVLRRTQAIFAAWLTGTAVLLAAATWAGAEPLFGGIEDLALVAGLLVLSYGAFVLVRGRLAGEDRFIGYGLATGGESALRLALAALVLATLASPRSLAWIMPVGPAVVVAVWLLSPARRRPAPGADAEPAEVQPPAATLAPPGTGGFLAATTAANGVAQVLLAGGPLVLVALRAGAAEISVFFVTITAARVPLVFALGGVLSRMLPPLTRLAARAETARIRRIALLTGLATVAGAVLAGAGGALLGPEVIALLFGAPFTPDRLFVTLAAGGAILATGTLLLNHVVIATGREPLLPLPWLAALAAATAIVLALEATPTLRVAWAFVIGEVVALLGLLAVVHRAAAAPRVSADVPGPPPAAGPTV